MGNDPKKPAPPPPTIDDVILDMRLSAKRFENEAKRCEREKTQMMNKAKQALAKNNDEGNKHNEISRCQTISHIRHEQTKRG